MSGDAHVRICESLGVQFPRATRLVVSIAGRQRYMWRAVDSEGEVLEILVQPQRDKAAALRLLRTMLRRQGFVPTVIVTDKLTSYGPALREIGFSGLHEAKTSAFIHMKSIFVTRRMAFSRGHLPRSSAWQC